jgi:hypothetical protein
MVEMIFSERCEFWTERRKRLAAKRGLQGWMAGRTSGEKTKCDRCGGIQLADTAARNAAAWRKTEDGN